MSLQPIKRLALLAFCLCFFGSGIASLVNLKVQAQGDKPKGSEPSGQPPPKTGAETKPPASQTSSKPLEAQSDKPKPSTTSQQNTKKLPLRVQPPPPLKTEDGSTLTANEDSGNDSRNQKNEPSGINASIEPFNTALKEYKAEKADTQAWILSFLPWVLTVLLLGGLTLVSYLFLKRKIEIEVSSVLKRASTAREAQKAELQQLKLELERIGKGLHAGFANQAQVSNSAPVLRQEKPQDWGSPPASPAPAKKTIQLPFALEEYLAQYGENQTTLSSDFRTGELVEDPDGKLLLVKDRALESGAGYVLPSQARFKQAQTYANYEKCYECLRPASGQVFITKLARVERTASAWRIVEKGVLEVR